MLSSDNTKEELTRLLEREYDTTSKPVPGVVSNSFTIRGWAVTTWGVLLGLAANGSSWEFAVFALLVVIGFAAIDAYHSWLYAVALSYITMIERGISAHYKAVTRGDDDPDVAYDFEIEVRTLNIGLFRQFPRLALHEIRKVRPKWFFTVFYPSLAVVAATVIGLTATSRSCLGPGSGGRERRWPRQ